MAYRGGDRRLRLIARAIRHERRDEIALMHGPYGLDALRQAASDLIALAGSAGVERGADGQSR